MKIVVSTFPFLGSAFKQLADDFPKDEIVFVNSKEEFQQEIINAEVLVTMLLKKDELEPCQSLKWIQALSAGVDTFPLDTILKKRITLTTGRGIHQHHMSEYAISMMILAARRIDRMILNQSKQTWDRNIPQDEIFGKKLGIIGLGSIGQSIANKASVFGMKTYGIKRTPSELEGVEAVYGLDKMHLIARQCDYIINLLPHTSSTHEIIDRSFFEAMKKDAVMINMGRGQTVNEIDLLHALKNKLFRMYISDVFKVEPLPESHPFWSLENLVITPHMCGPNIYYMQKAYPIVKDNLIRYKNSQPLINLYQFDAGY